MEDDRTLSYRLEDYDYALPEELIAQAPCPGREESRLLVLDRASSGIGHHGFEDLPSFLREGDVLVTNDTRVVQARLLGRKETGGRVELLVLDPYKDREMAEKEGYQCLIRACKRPSGGGRVLLDKGYVGTLQGPVQNGRVLVRFSCCESIWQMMSEIGEVPLPPYIVRDGESSPVDDAAAYQTVYALKPGAVAAPTAGLHFSRETLSTLETMGVERVSVTLHVGYGTFAPVRDEDIRRHRMHHEHIEISGESVSRITRAKGEGRRIVAVGTTVVRTLEWLAIEFGRLLPFLGMCDHYIYPGYRFRVVDTLITNFHLPKSSLLLLVSAFAGREAVLGAYGEAVKERYRFFSYGDAMLIL